jgi:Ribosomal protein L7/L12 C-terminal domain
MSLLMSLVVVVVGVVLIVGVTVAVVASQNRRRGFPGPNSNPYTPNPYTPNPYPMGQGFGGQVAAGPGRPAFPGLSPQAQGEIGALVAQGKKIEAIKLVRAQTGMGLKDAKNLVDAIATGRA